MRKITPLIPSLLSILCLGTVLNASEIMPSQSLLISKAGELIFKETGEPPLKPTTRFFHGDWKFVEGGMLGTQNEPHLATIRMDQDFNNVVFQFEVMFLDPGEMFFCSWNKGKGGHSMDAVVNQKTGQLKIIKADLDGKDGPDVAVVIAQKAGLKIELNRWYTCTIEQKGEKAALHFDGQSIEGQHPLLTVPKFNFFINVGGSQRTEKTMIRNIALWKAE
jgi:hypothetical protein